MSVYQIYHQPWLPRFLPVIYSNTCTVSLSQDLIVAQANVPVCIRLFLWSRTVLVLGNRADTSPNRRASYRIPLSLKYVENGGLHASGEGRKWAHTGLFLRPLSSSSDRWFLLGRHLELWVRDLHYVLYCSVCYTSTRCMIYYAQHLFPV